MKRDSPITSTAYTRMWSAHKATAPIHIAELVPPIKKQQGRRSSRCDSAEVKLVGLAQ